MIEARSTRVERLDVELQNFRRLNQDERFGGCSQYHHQQPPWHCHRLGQPHELNEEGGEYEFEDFSESTSQQYYKQQQYNDADESSSSSSDEDKENRQPQQQLNEAGETYYSSDEESEWESGWCLISRHLSKVDLIPVFKKNPNFDEFSEWVKGVEKFFELYEIPKDEQVELVAYSLEEEVFWWWQLMEYLWRQSYIEQPIQHWVVMKDMLMARFLSLDDFITNEFEDFSESPSKQYCKQTTNDVGYSSSSECPIPIYKRNPNYEEFREWALDVEWFFPPIPIFKNNPNYEEFSEWVLDVEWFFECYEIPENEQVDIVACRLGEEAFAWWELYQKLTRQVYKQPIQDWIQMKDLLMGRFLSP